MLNGFDGATSVVSGFKPEGIYPIFKQVSVASESLTSTWNIYMDENNTPGYYPAAYIMLIKYSGQNRVIGR